MSSQTWQRLPAHLLEPLQLGVISLVEASELFDLCLLNPGKFFQPPDHLQPALKRIRLLYLPTYPGRH